MKKIRWGIIGCGDVTEVKSGPAFNKVSDSELIAVMRRDAAKAEDYASRHHVPKWYTDAGQLIRDADINAIYIATPPSSHEEYTLEAIRAGKPVYVEKPMSTDAASARRMREAAARQNHKLTVAHYRRAQPLFQKIKQLIESNSIGNIRFARLEIYKRALTKEELAVPKTAWRVDTAIAGGGLFHDLSPHQLDMMYYFFGEPAIVKGIATNQSGLYKADDIVSGSVLFRSGVMFNGLWCFNTDEKEERDWCEIVGDKGRIEFSFFDHRPVVITIDGKKEEFSFDPLHHVQQPMIAKVVDYFLDRGNNPCSGEEGVKVMEMMDEIAGH